MLLPPFRGADLKAFDRAGTDITAGLFAPSGFMKVDADYTPKPRRVARRGLAADLPVPRLPERVRRRHRLRPAAPDLHPAHQPQRHRHRARPTAHRDAVRDHGPAVARTIADRISTWRHRPTHTASMAAMGAACVASAGAGLRTGTAAAMTMYPVVPDYTRSRHGRSLKDTYGEIGLAAHWIKHLLHFVFIYKAKARPGWAFLPE